MDLLKGKKRDRQTAEGSVEHLDVYLGQSLA